MGHGNPQRQENFARHAELARKLVLQAWPEIVSGLIKKAAGGGYQHTKLLLELCEIADKEDSQLDNQRKEQLCDALLGGMGLRLPWELGLLTVQEPTAEAGTQVEPETTGAL